MNVITQEQDLAVRKHCMKALRELNLRSLNEIEPHKMQWNDLQKVAKRMVVASRDALEKVGDKTSTEDRSQIETVVDGVLEVADAINRECDIRTAEGSREPRDSPYSAAQLARRPGFNATDTDDEVETTSTALTAGQSFRSWAKARSTVSEHLRGMNAGQFLRAMVSDNKTDQERRALAEATDSAGGYTVPDILSAELIDGARAQSVVMRAGARTVPLTSDNNTIAKVLTDPTPAWRLEAGAVANEDGTFGAVVLTPRSLAVSVDISAELMADSLNLGTSLPNILMAAMGVELDRVALIGTGTAPQPLGIANTSGIGTFAQDDLISSYGNLSKARTAILTANRGPVSAYVMHPRDEGSFVDLSDSTGQPLMAPNAVSAIPMLTTTSLPVDGGTGTNESTIIAGNFAHLLIGIRSGIQVELIKGPKYISNLQYTLIAHMRADVAVEDPSAFYTITGVGQAA